MIREAATLRSLLSVGMRARVYSLTPPLIIIFVEQMIFAGSVKQMPGYINCILGEIPFGGVVVDNPVRLLVITLNESGAHMDECLL